MFAVTLSCAVEHHTESPQSICHPDNCYSPFHALAVDWTSLGDIAMIQPLSAKSRSPRYLSALLVLAKCSSQLAIHHEHQNLPFCCLFHHPSEHPHHFVCLSTKDVSVLRTSLSCQLQQCLGVETVDRRQHGNRAKTAHREFSILFLDHGDLLCFPQLFCLLGPVRFRNSNAISRTRAPSLIGRVTRISYGHRCSIHSDLAACEWSVKSSLKCLCTMSVRPSRCSTFSVLPASFTRSKIGARVGGGGTFRRDGAPHCLTSLHRRVTSFHLILCRALCCVMVRVFRSTGSFYPFTFQTRPAHFNHRVVLWIEV